MQFTVKAGVLKSSLDLLSGGLPKKSTMPILSHVLLAVTKEALSLVVSDLDMFVSLTCETESRGASAMTTLPYARLRAIAASFPSDTVLTFEPVDNPDFISIKGGNAAFKMYGISATPFPAMPMIDSDESFTISAEDLRRILKQTGFAAAKEESKQFAMQGVRMDSALKNLSAMSTDGHRASIADTQTPIGFKLDAVIPRAALAQLLILFAEGSDTIAVSASDNHLLFAGSAGRLITKTVSGQFPAVRNLFTTRGDEILLPREELADKIKGVLLMSEEISKAVKMVFENGRLSLSSQDQDGHGETTIDVEYQEPLTIGFNGRYLVDFLESVKTDQVTMRAVDDSQPVFLRPVGEEGYGHTIMPIRLKF